MAYFAELDEGNIVTRVVSISNEDCLDVDKNESEEVGVAFCRSLFGDATRWKKTSYNHKIRRQYAGIGYLYFEPLDVFIEPQPYPSWAFDPETGNWVCPVSKPSVPDIYFLVWDEEDQTWYPVLGNTL
jgi:hypothetical protein